MAAPTGPCSSASSSCRSAGRVLVVVVSRGNQVTQKVVDAGEDVRSDDLVQAANYLNTEFAGLAAARRPRSRAGAARSRSGRSTTS